MKITYIKDDENLSAKEFLELVQKIWPGEYSLEYTQKALKKTINITAWYKEELVGCVRILTDGYFFGTIPDILVAPDFQSQEIGTKLMEMAWDVSPTSLFFGAQPGNEIFFEKLGYKKSMQSYSKTKPRLENSKNNNKK